MVRVKILYGSPAWSGLCSAADRSRLNAFLRRCKRYNYCSNDFPAIEDLFSDADDTVHYLNVLSITQRTYTHPSREI